MRAVVQGGFKIETFRRECNSGEVPSIVIRRYERIAVVKGVGILYGEVGKDKCFRGTQEYRYFSEEGGNWEF